MNQTSIQFLAVGALYVALVGAALYVSSNEILLMAALLVIPLGVTARMRPTMPLWHKVRLASPIAFAMPVMLCFLWALQSPERTPVFVLGGLCGLVYMVCFDVIAKMYLLNRNGR